MPIRPENRSRYPKNWKQIRTSILERAHNQCEFCGVGNHTMRLNPKTEDNFDDSAFRPHTRELQSEQFACFVPEVSQRL